VITEGRKREVRRMLEAVGLPVRRLVRTRIGPVRLGRLRPGELRDLEPEEVRALYRAAGL
jgi:23S rRNA pseudouridine2605 synthase